MPTTNQYLTYAEIAFAGYAGPLVEGTGLNSDAYAQAGMAQTQAEQFDQKWAVLAQADIGDGFSAVLFQRVDSNGSATGEKVLGIRGTEASHWGIDYAVDVFNIALLGTTRGMPQYQSLEGFYQQMVSSGKLGTSEQFTVAGHSLGGFLAQAFTAKHDAVVQGTYTYNSPGFTSTLLVSNIATQLLEFFGITDASIPSNKIFNARAIDGFSATSGLGRMIGYVDTFNIEASGPVANHSIVTLTDSITLQDMLAKLAPSVPIGTSNAFIQTASNRHDNTLESLLDAMRRMIAGPSVTSTGTGDRNALYADLKTLTDSDAFEALAGKVTLTLATSNLATTAKTDFAAFLALNALSPVVISTTDPAAIAALKATNPHLSLAWSADNNARLYGDTTKIFDYSDNWYTDRAYFLQGLVAHNLTDSANSIALEGKVNANYTYTDFASGQSIKFRGAAVNANTQEAQQVMFGNDQDNELVGSNAVAFGLGDRLYGGRGIDTIDGKGGDDYLEGNDGDDTLNGGEGGDTLVGGAGNDTLIGGDGGDTLKGGQGTDTYTLRAGESGTDIITDSDGLGSIKVIAADNSETILGSGIIKKLADGTNAWQSEDKRFTYTTRTESDASTTLNISGGGVTAIVKNFSSGNLGITLPDTAPTQSDPTTSQQIVGDLAPMDVNPAEEGVQVEFDALGNIIGDPSQPTPDRADTLYDSVNDDEIIAGGGDDNVDALRGGSDWIKSGAGDDLVSAGAGNDLVELGSGRDMAYGGTGDDRIYGNTLSPLAEVLAQTTTLPAAEANLLDGGDGDDTLVGDSADDALFGGAGKDLLVGGAGNDKMFGDMQTSRTDGLWDLQRQPLYDAQGNAAGSKLEFTALNYQTAAQQDADLMLGGAGDDVMVAQGGDDYLDGGADNDYLVGGTGADVLVGGTGDDELDGDGDSVDTGLLNYAAASGHGNDYLDGGSGADTMRGGGGNDQLFGGEGNDFMRGDAGTLAGESHGKDYLEGGAGDDEMVGDGNDDVLYGGAGNDNLWGDSPTLDAVYVGADYLDGGDGNDYLEGGGKDDYLLGGAGNDRLHGDGSALAEVDHGNDYLDGGDGDDYLKGYGGDDVLTGGAGDDTLIGDLGNDILEGGVGKDQLAGGAGDDTYVFNVGDSGSSLTQAEIVDDLEGVNRIQLNGMSIGSMELLQTTEDGTYLLQTGQDSLFVRGLTTGAIGTVEVSGESFTGRQFFGKTYASDATQTTVSAYATVQGGKLSDTLTATGGNASFAGGAGNDVLIGGGGNNTYSFDLGDGQDRLVDASGGGTIAFGAGIDAASIKLGNANGKLVLSYSDTDSITIEGPVTQYRFDDGTVMNDEQMMALLKDPIGITGTEADDVLFGGSGNDFMFGRDGDDVIASGAGQDTVFGENGNDTVRAGAGADLVSGGIGNDTLYGEAGSDQLWGQSGDDALYGGDGDDELTGGDGNDTLSGGQGDDILLSGGSGIKTYQFDLGDGKDVVLSAVGARHIRFGSGVSLADVKLFLSPVDAPAPYVLVQYSTQDSVLIQRGSGNGSLDYQFTDGTVLSHASLAAQATQTSRAPYARLGTTGNDAFSAQQAALVIGGGGNDQLFGSSFNDTLKGGTGNDKLYGRGGDDMLDGGTGSDDLFGEGGADVLQGGSGNDNLSGGYGSDTYIYARGDGSDVLAEYRSGAADVNVLRFTDLLPADVRFSREASGNLKIYVNNSSDAIEIKDWYNDPATRMQQVVYADGTVLDTTTLDDLAQSPIVDEGDGGNLTGTAYNDVIVGTSGNNVIDGAGGDDTLHGGAGSDTYLMSRSMGLDTVYEDAGGTNVLKLAAGLSFDQLVTERKLNDLYVHFTGTPNGAVLKNYYASSNTWVVSTDNGDQKALGEVITDNAASLPAMTVEQLRNRWIVQAKTELLQSYVDDFVYSSYVKSYAYITPYALSVDYSSDRVVYGFSDASQFNDGAYFERASNTSTRSEMVYSTYTYSVIVPDGRFVVVPPATGDATGYGGVMFDYSDLGSSGEPRAYFLNLDGTPIGFDPSRLPVSSAPVTALTPVPNMVTVSVNQSSQLVDSVFEHIVGGASSNVINTWEIGTVDAGDGDDIIYGSGGAEYPGQFMYGGGGNDLVLAFRNNDVLIGGDGDDYLGGGGGNDIYHLIASETGSKIIDEAAYTWLVPQLSDNRPVWNDGDRWSVDTVEFGAGIELDSLHIRRGKYASPYATVYDNGYVPDPSLYDTLDFSWGESKVARVLLARPSDGWISPDDDGYGIEYFTFSDGTKLSLADMQARVDAQSSHSLELWGGDGIQVISLMEGVNTIRFGPDITHNDISVFRLDSDLVLTRSNGTDQWRVQDWYANPANSTTFSVHFDNGVVWGATPLTHSDSLLNGTDGDDMLMGNAAQNTLNGGAGNDQLQGGSGNDSYVLQRKGGRDIVIDTSGALDRVLVQGEITAADIRFSREGANLVAAIADTDDALVLTDWFGMGRIEQIVVGDTVIDGAMIEALFGNQAPVAQNDMATVFEDGPAVSGNVLSNDSGANAGSTLAVASPGTYAGQYGSLAMAADGSYTYVLDNTAAGVQELGEGQVVQDQFAYVTTDGSAEAAATLSVTVVGVNDAPVVANLVVDQSGRENQAFGFTLPDSIFADQDQGDTLTYSASVVDDAGQLQPFPSWLTFNSATRSFSGSPGAESGGDYRLRVIATDSSGVMTFTDFTIAIADQGSLGDGRIYGGSAQDTLNGGSGDEFLYAGSGDDVLFGNAGNDYLGGGNGNDILYGGSGSDKLYGGADNDTLEAGEGDDWLRGGTGNDIMSGGLGDDLYEVDSTADQVIELATHGNDTVEASLSHTLSANVENLILTGVAATNGVGNDLDNLLQGNNASNILVGEAGNDTLNGKQGQDTLIGGAGNDTYLLADDIDEIVEEADGGRDSVISRHSFILAANVEDGILIGSATSLSGNALSNVLTGNNAANTLDGGAGADVLIGGKGNDLYIVDSQADTVIENAAEGNDTVQSSVTYTLGDNIEHLTLTGTAEAGMGNDLANRITGNTASNKLWGGAGNDSLDGGEGADILFGGLGNDKYWVDSSSDLIVENALEGTDTVYASVTYALADNVERLTLTGSDNINAIGNASNNRLEGNAGNNVLFGGLGNDTYVWGRGSGQDIVANFDAGKPSGDTVQLGAGIAEADLGMTRRGNDLILSINGSSDQLTVANYFENAGKGANALEKIRFADGTSWNHAAVLSRTTSQEGTSSAQMLPPEVLAGNPTALFDRPDPVQTKTGNTATEPLSVAESIAAARDRFEQGLQQLKYSVDEQGSMSRSEFTERRALPLLWNLQDALLNLQLAKNPDGRFKADISMDSRATRDLGLGISVLAAPAGMNGGRLDQIARPLEIAQFDLANLQ